MFLYIQKLFQRFFKLHNKKKELLNFKQKYKLCNKISKGSYGTTYICLKDEKQYAVKIIYNKKNKTIDEINILKQLNHDNIIKYVESFQNIDKTYIVTEYYSGSDLFDKIMIHGGRIDEKKTKIIMKQILEGIQYLHSKNIIHRDLKLSNILFHKDNVKIIDFGISIIKEPSKLIEDEIGSVGFIAPEVIQGCYNRECDLWSIGCITFIMLFGFNPFNISSNSNINKVYENILKGFKNEVLDGYGAFFPKSIKVSFGARDFIASLLTDKITRLNVSEALTHPWIISS